MQSSLSPPSEQKQAHEPLWLALRFPTLPYDIQGLTPEDNEAFEPNTALEKQALQQLQECCYYFSPYVELQTASNEPGLLLEVSRCLTLFKGLKALSKGLFKQLSAFSFQFEYGLAHTAAGAWLLSWQQHPINNNDTRDVFIQRLQNTPISLLQSNANIINALDKTGFNTLGDVIKQIQQGSIAAFNKRFGLGFGHYIQDVFAIESKNLQKNLFDRPLKPYEPPLYFCEHQQLDYPLENIQLIQPLLETLLQNFYCFLQKRQLQSERIVWRFYTIYNEREDLQINTCQLHTQTDKASWQLFLELSLIQLEAKPLPFAVDTVELFCDRLSTINTQTRALAFDGKSQSNNEELQITLAKIQSRLNDNAIYKVSYHPHHVPEKSLQRININQRANVELGIEQALSERPTWLLEAPQKIQQKNGNLYWCGELSLLEGPERIEGYWWEDYCARDYFVAKRDDGLTLWVYQDIQNRRWYTHGVFA